MLIGQPLMLEDYHVGKKVFVTEDVAFIAEEYVNLFSNTTDISFPSGIYEVSKIEKNKINATSLSHKAIPHTTLYLKYEKWTKTEEPVPIVLNPDGDVLFADAIFVEGGIKNVISDIENFIKINNSRFDCIQCKGKLNIVSHNVRICNHCEKNWKQK